ncbi:uncharacterized protein ARMOST_07701 [Armillaria ostoyae]|uniref:Uncharacterized protein n=1 Tax=Armillaria ostoyae TaxID=47428 RepID=A0A284R6I7_ARMOS|nr:uncharacterized protein ARMOST_07701 [Armillaria ostoyae]
MPAGDGMQEYVHPPMESVITSMSALVAKEDTLSPLALEEPKLPWPPAKEFKNIEAVKMIEDHPQLFKITTPIAIDVFEKYLETHPNPNFIQSVVTMLKEGFWPWTDT